MTYPSVVSRLILLAALLVPVHGPAVTIESAVEQALARDAGLQQLSLRARSLDYQAVAERALPDPELTLGAEGLPINDPFAADMMTMYKVGIRQRFPAGDSRQLASEQRQAESRSLAAERQARVRDVTLQTRLAWLDWASAHRSRQRIDAMLDQLEQLVEISQRRFEAGSGRLQDESQAHLELALLERRQLDALTRTDEARARLERWIGTDRAHDASTTLPDWSTDGDASSDRDLAIANHPELIAAEIRAEAGGLGAELARQAYRPRWMIEAGYGHQRGENPNGRRMADKLFAMATVSLPLFTDRRQDQRVDAALAERDAELARGQLIAQRLLGELDRQQTLEQRLGERRDLLETRILPRAQATVEATLSAYEADRASFDELVRARLARLEAALDLIDTRRLQLGAIARIASLTDKELP